MLLHSKDIMIKKKSYIGIHFLKKLKGVHDCFPKSWGIDILFFKIQYKILIFLKIYLGLGGSIGPPQKCKWFTIEYYTHTHFD